ncbi:hypothetical protein [Rufibacter psychrotolerans]|uniref:hypothetical protein n=1 Tax=Rufibacter psychrotolerans TaxID=2812556 RepID=UPI001967575F|nr:hypothetical protein [Rufibacter sp. SYSU D00308]
MTEEEFDANYVEALDAVLEAMAENKEIDPGKFYSMTYILENLRFFSPVIYGVLQEAKK